MPTGSATAPRRAAPKAGARPRAKVAAMPAAGALARWWKVALLVVIATIGLPIAHAIFGEGVALHGCAVLLGFLRGRWTAA